MQSQETDRASLYINLPSMKSGKRKGIFVLLQWRFVLVL